MHRSPQQSQPSHWRSPSELLCHLVCSPLAALHHHRCTPRTNSRGAPGRNWFRSSGGWEGLPTTNSHLWPRCTATNGRPRQICFLARGNLCRPTKVEDKDIRERLRFFCYGERKMIYFPQNGCIQYNAPLLTTSEENEASRQHMQEIWIFAEHIVIRLSESRYICIELEIVMRMIMQLRKHKVIVKTRLATSECWARYKWHSHMD